MQCMHVFMYACILPLILHITRTLNFIPMTFLVIYSSCNKFPNQFWQWCLQTTISSALVLHSRVFVLCLGLLYSRILHACISETVRFLSYYTHPYIQCPIKRPRYISRSKRGFKAHISSSPSQSSGQQKRAYGFLERQQLLLANLHLACSKSRANNHAQLKLVDLPRDFIFLFFYHHHIISPAEHSHIKC